MFLSLTRYIKNRPRILHFISLSIVILVVLFAVSVHGQDLNLIIDPMPGVQIRCKYPNGWEDNYLICSPPLESYSCVNPGDTVCDYSGKKMCIPQGKKCSDYTVTDYTVTPEGQTETQTGDTSQQRVAWNSWCRNSYEVYQWDICNTNTLFACDNDTDVICRDVSGTVSIDYCQPQSCPSSSQRITDIGYIKFNRSTKTCKISIAKPGSTYATKAECEASFEQSQTTLPKERSQCVDGTKTDICVGSGQLAFCLLPDAKNICSVQIGNEYGLTCVPGSCSTVDGKKVLVKYLYDKTSQACRLTVRSRGKYSTLEGCQLDAEKIKQADQTKQQAESKKDTEKKDTEKTSGATQQTQPEAAQQIKYSYFRSIKACIEDPNGSYTDRAVCETLNREETTVPEGPYTCANKEKRQCEARAGGKYASREACQEDCVPTFKDEGACKSYYRKNTIQLKAQQLLCQKYDTGDSDVAKTLVEACVQEVTQIRENFKTPDCTETGFENTVQRLVQFDNIIFALDDLKLAEQKEEAVRAAAEQKKDGVKRGDGREQFLLSEETRRRAKTFGFQEQFLERPSIARVVDILVLSDETLANRLTSYISRLVYLPETFQQELAEEKRVLITKAQIIEEKWKARGVSSVEQEQFEAILASCLEPHWEATSGTALGKEFTAVAKKIGQGNNILEIMDALSAFCKEQRDENQKKLFERGVLKFRDVENEWYLEVFEHPKQKSFKGAGGFMKPKDPFLGLEAVLAILRSTNTQDIEGSCETKAIPSSVKGTREWGECAVTRALELFGGGEKAAKTLRMNRSLLDPLPREIFALWVTKFMNSQDATKGVLQAPTQADINAVCQDFQDCGKFKKDPEIIEAVATMKVNGIMTGKADNQGQVTQFGFGKNLLRAEAAKVLLLVEERQES